MKRSPRALGLAALVVSLGATTLPSLSAHALEPRVVVATTAPIPRGDVVVSSPMRTTFDLVLARDNAAALSHFLSDLYRPGSTSYHHFLSTAAFARRFGASSEEITQLRHYFAGYGLSVGAASKGRVILHVSGSTSDIARAFATPVLTVRRSDGVLAAQFARSATLPSSVASLVTGVAGLSSVVAASVPTLRASASTRTSPGTCPSAGSSTTNAPNALGGYTLQQQAQLYGLDHAWAQGNTGVGQTIAIYELGIYNSSDVNTYASCYSLKPSITSVDVDGGGSSGGADEATLDIEEVAGLAPGAAITVYAGPNSGSGPTDTYARIADDNTASIVTTSWGTCEGDPSGSPSAEQAIFEQMAAQGQTVFASAGDYGSSDCTGITTNALAVDDPASQPFVTGVGGLSVNSISPLSETVWNSGSSSGGAGGGGVSTLWSRPSWQVAPGITSAQTMRLVPDLSVMGDPNTGFIEYYSGSWGSIGGTSIGSPLMSAVAAVAAQSCDAGRLGFLNPTLYAMASTGYNDVTTGSNDIFGVGGYSAGPGYDMASGLGSPNPATFLAGLCPPTAATITSHAVLSASRAVVGGAEPTLTLTLTTASGLPLANAMLAVSATVTTGFALIDNDQSSRTKSGNANYTVTTDANGSVSLSIFATSPGPVTLAVTYQGGTVYSTTLHFTSTAARPGAPSFSVAPLVGALRLSVKAPSSSVKVTGYQYSLNGAKWVTFAATSRTITITRLARAKTYRVVVRALSAGGAGPASKPTVVKTR
ncbi:MAG TPA: protease pro-enzyme activation domain-containing protein [Acidimicrobiales bacterium]|nr:protease pro-enzyme activation domain-containing protein [Acidimicrobiales bacterium]